MRIVPFRHGSISQRVVRAVTLTVAFFLGLQAVLAYLTMHAQEDDLSDELLRQEVRQLISSTARPGLTPEGPLAAAPRVSAYLARGQRGEAALPSYLRGLAPGMYQRDTDGRTLHVAVLDSEDGRLSVALDATQSESRVHRFGYTLIGLWLLGVAATALIARAVARFAVGPIVDATTSIARWLPETPGRSGGGGNGDDEAALLMETFNRFRDKADEAMARQREFAANLEHEIRTPLTAIRTDAELTAIDGALAATERSRIERIVASVDDIIATMEASLSSSAGEVAPPEPLDVGEVVATACQSLADRAERRGLRIEMTIPAAAVLLGDRQALLTVCRNIVGNAIEHAAPARLTIAGDARALSFTDDGPGIEPALLPDVFERYHRGHRNDEAAPPAAVRRGLGLAIARRLCDLRGWRLSAHSPAARGGGTTFRIEFVSAT